MSDTTIDKVLVKMVYAIMRYDPDTDILEEDREAVNQAKSALYDLILKEVVGEDEKIIKLSGNSRFDQEVTNEINGANEVRAEMRNKLAELFK